MKKILLLGLLMTGSLLQAQELYTDFEGNSKISWGWTTGTLDTAFANPVPNIVNSSNTAGRYIRNQNYLFDNISIFPNSKLNNIAPYSTYDGLAPRIKMKVYSTAPIGTLVELQFGSKTDTVFPSGIHSQYQATTTTTNQWEELIFNFVGIPVGSTVDQNSIDKIVLLFAPNSNTNSVFYFDDLMGPEQTTLSVTEYKKIGTAEVFPNPANELSKLEINMKEAGDADITIRDITGKIVAEIFKGTLSPGKHLFDSNISEYKDGIYYYCIRSEEETTIKKLIIN